MKLRRNEEKKSLNILLLLSLFDRFNVLCTRALLSRKEHLPQDGHLQIFLEHGHLGFLCRHSYVLPFAMRSALC